jgi:hypothetical protein
LGVYFFIRLPILKAKGGRLVAKKKKLNKKRNQNENYEVADELLGKPETETNVKEQINHPKKRM